jgi:hypothetical protein
MLPASGNKKATRPHKPTSWAQEGPSHEPQPTTQESPGPTNPTHRHEKAAHTKLARGPQGKHAGGPGCVIGVTRCDRCAAQAVNNGTIKAVGPGPASWPALTGDCVPEQPLTPFKIAAVNLELQGVIGGRPERGLCSAWPGGVGRDGSGRGAGSWRGVRIPGAGCGRVHDRCFGFVSRAERGSWHQNGDHEPSKVVDDPPPNGNREP